MTSFANLIGFNTRTSIKGDSFYKKYLKINDKHWSRIKNASLLLANENIGPKIIAIDEKTHTIEFEQVTPFDNGDENMIPDMSVYDIRNAIISLVDKLHSLGYAHGDLHIENLGFKDNKIYILDHDTVYKIDDLYHGKLPWLEKWMKIGFEWNESLEDFVNNDYDTWNSDWLEDNY